MAKGSPVIAASASAFPEVLGDAACFFEPSVPGSLRDRLISLWNDEKLRAKLSRAGHRQAAEFSWERMGRETLSVYREALKINTNTV